MQLISICALLLPLSFQEGQEEQEAPAEVDRPVLESDTGWTWTRKEDRQIRELQREVKDGVDRFRLRESQWKIDTYGSARLAAELGYYLNLFEATVLEQLDTRRQFSEAPTVMVFATRKEFQEKAPMRDRAALIYHAVTDPAGKSKHRIRILDNHLYTYVEGVESPTLRDLPLPELRAEAARAILIGVLGRPEVCVWFEKGTGAWFSTWNMHDPPREALDLRLRRSTAAVAIREHLARQKGWLPPLERLTNLRELSWDSRQAGGEVGNDAWAESMVDLLISERRAKKLRERLLREFIKVGLSGSGTATVDKKDLRALEKLWKRHVTEVFAAAPASAKGE